MARSECFILGEADRWRASVRREATADERSTTLLGDTRLTVRAHHMKVTTRASEKLFVPPISRYQH